MNVNRNDLKKPSWQRYKTNTTLIEPKKFQITKKDTTNVLVSFLLTHFIAQCSIFITPENVGGYRTGALGTNWLTAVWKEHLGSLRNL